LLIIVIFQLGRILYLLGYINWHLRGIAEKLVG
jgi:hypothetical protein